MDVSLLLKSRKFSPKRYFECAISVLAAIIGIECVVLFGIGQNDPLIRTLLIRVWAQAKDIVHAVFGSCAFSVAKHGV